MLRIEEALVDEARSRVGEADLSGYISGALERQLQHDRIRELLRAMDREAGPVSAEIMDEVRRQWPTPGSQST